MYNELINFKAMTIITKINFQDLKVECVKFNAHIRQNTAPGPEPQKVNKGQCYVKCTVSSFCCKGSLNLNNEIKRRGLKN